MWSSDTQLHKGAVTFSMMKKHESRQTVELRTYRTLADMSARHADTAWQVMRSFLDSLLADEKLTAVPLLPLPTDQPGESRADLAGGFGAGSVFIKTEQSGSRGRRKRTYHPVGKLAEVIDERNTHINWCQAATTNPRLVPVERPTALQLTVMDPVTKRDFMSLSLRELSVQYLPSAPRGLLSFNKDAIQDCSTVYLVTKTLSVGEMELNIHIRDRERVLYQATPTPVAMKYQKIRLDRRSRAMHPRRTVVSMHLATWVPKTVQTEEELEEVELQDIDQEEELGESAQEERVAESEALKPEKLELETGSAGEPKVVPPVGLVTP